VDEARQEKREEIIGLTEAIVCLGKIGFQNVPIDSLKQARLSIEGCVLATADAHL
jgi:hypothetical protein